MPDHRDQIGDDARDVDQALTALAAVSLPLAKLRQVLKRHFPEADSVEITIGEQGVWAEFTVVSDDRRADLVAHLIANPCYGVPSFLAVHFDCPPTVSAQIDLNWSPVP